MTSHCKNEHRVNVGVRSELGGNTDGGTEDDLEQRRVLGGIGLG